MDNNQNINNLKRKIDEIMVEKEKLINQIKILKEQKNNISEKMFLCNKQIKETKNVIENLTKNSL